MPAPRKRDRLSMLRARYFAPLAMTTMLARTEAPSARSTTYGHCSLCRAIACEATLRLAPNFCACERAPAKRQSGNAGGETEIVFNFGAGAGLTAGCRDLDQAHIEALGGAVDGGREAGRPGADDQQTVHPRVIDLRIDAQTGRQFEIAWILEDVLAAADHHRHVFGRHVESFQRGLRVGVGTDVEGVEWERI